MSCGTTGYQPYHSTEETPDGGVVDGGLETRTPHEEQAGEDDGLGPGLRKDMSSGPVTVDSSVLSKSGEQSHITITSSPSPSGCAEAMHVVPAQDPAAVPLQDAAMCVDAATDQCLVSGLPAESLDVLENFDQFLQDLHTGEPVPIYLSPNASTDAYAVAAEPPILPAGIPAHTSLSQDYDANWESVPVARDEEDNTSCRGSIASSSMRREQEAEAKLELARINVEQAASDALLEKARIEQQRAEAAANLREQEVAHRERAAKLGFDQAMAEKKLASAGNSAASSVKSSAVGAKRPLPSPVES